MFLNTHQLFSSLSKVLQKALNDSSLLHQTQLHNPWFTNQNSEMALQAWIKSLEKSEQWMEKEKIEPEIKPSGTTVGVIMAGNLPLVGLHDLLCVLISGHSAVVKLSSQDNVLMKFVIQGLREVLPELNQQLQVSEDFIKNADAYIGTGSNNSARYFEYYFKNKPHIIRRNRNSVAILDANNTTEELIALGHDVFDYFGMGCRNVTRLFLPLDFDFKPLFEAWEQFSEMIHHHKYANNYTYHKAIFLMNLDKHLDNGFVILTERNAIHAPVSLVNYSFYQNKTECLQYIAERVNDIQCVVSSSGDEFPFAVPFGKSQQPDLWDYADGINTLEFLKKI